MFYKLGENQMHKCAVAVNACQAIKDGPCKRFFDTYTETQSTTFNTKGRPVYRRPLTRDLRVVGYNMAMMLDWRGHLNVESASNEKSILYLYDYLFKGLKKVLAEARKKAMERGESGDVIDEIKIFIDGRLLSSMDATWRIFGFCNYPAQQPSTKVVNVMTESQSTFFLEQGKATDMLMYFNRPEELSQLKFEDFFKGWHYATKKPTSTNANAIVHEIKFTRQSKTFFIVKWLRNQANLVRISMIYPAAGEKYYLRLILRNRPVLNWKEGYVWERQTFNTYQQAAKASGLLEDETEAVDCFTEAYTMGNHTPSGLRGLFCMLTIDGSSSLAIVGNEEFVKAMTSDYHERNSDLSKRSKS
jgi:hypothetical protein